MGNDSPDSNVSDVRRRTVLKSVGSIGGAALLAERADAQFTDESEYSPISDVQVAEAFVEFSPNGDEEFGHFDKLPRYGISREEENLYLVRSNEEMRDHIRNNDAVTFGHGLRPLPVVLNNGRVEHDLPISTGETAPHKFLPSESPVTIPSVQVTQATDQTIVIKTRGDEYQVEVGEELVVPLEQKNVTSPAGSTYNLTPQVRTRNHGVLTAQQLTGSPEN
jgi:hypothetical protein